MVTSPRRGFGTPSAAAKTLKRSGPTRWARAITALRDGDDRSFLAERTRALLDTARAYFARCAEWGADDSPSLDSLVVTED